MVWECELKKDNFGDTVARIQKQLNANRKSWLGEIADRRKRREEWREEMKSRKEREMILIKHLHNGNDIPIYSRICKLFTS